MSSPQSSGSSSAGVRLGADGERVSERLGLHRQLLSKLAHSQALTGQDIDSGYQQVTELMTTLLRVERGSVWRFDQRHITVDHVGNVSEHLTFDLAAFRDKHFG